MEHCLRIMQHPEVSFEEDMFDGFDLENKISELTIAVENIMERIRDLESVYILQFNLALTN